MEIKIGIKDQEQANRFLRALWAELRIRFKKQAWQFSPYKNGEFRQIIFGQVDLGLADGPIMVGISYKKRGCIETIFFERPFSTPLGSDSFLASSLEDVVFSAMEKKDDLVRIYMASSIQTGYSRLSEYIGNGFSIRSWDEKYSVLAMPIWAYDEVDARFIFKSKANNILDVLAVETNVPVWQVSEASAIDEAPYSAKVDEIFVNDADWIDGVPIKNDLVVLSLEGKKFLDFIAISDDLGDDQIIFLRACRHFHMALKQGAGSLTLQDYNEMQENIMVLYMSALEVVSAINAPAPSTCPTCGQPVYRIRQRVSEFAARYLPAHIVRNIKFYYDRRSKYLHAGVLLSSQDYVGVTIPQLDADSPTGCKSSIAPSYIMNLKESVGYCLRQTMQSLVNNQMPG